ncbi:MAG TPA: 5-methyltetrahydropteroyltriglutamate--homocysteine S-methyltransferase, partial [Verrucomicrobium sp.]|nr:5-methyltetrahydropteroyltriglutamate--homocysteine S-methyltransferase [Verrucomicrobium sp.]
MNTENSTTAASARLQTHSLGFPRMGAQRELKHAVESYWKGKTDAAALQETARELRQRHWLLQQQAGLSLVPCNEFSFYDQMLDMTLLLGSVPPRFKKLGITNETDLRFAVARGVVAEKDDSADHHHDCGCQASTFASEMTKWFDTNYHYIVPEMHPDTIFSLSSSKPFDEFKEALALGVKTKPVLVGPLTYLTLAKVHGDEASTQGFDRYQLLPQLLTVYTEVLQRLAAEGAEWVQLDEPILALDLTPQQRDLLLGAYDQLRLAAPGLKLMVATYFGELRENMSAACALSVDALHIDAVRAPGEVAAVLERLSAPKVLSLGIVDGRNIWRNDFDASLQVIKTALAKVGADRLWLAPSCSLLHVPNTLEHETKLDAGLKSWLAFASEKLVELTHLAHLALDEDAAGSATALAENRAVQADRRNSPRIHNPAVKNRVAAIQPDDSQRISPFAGRQTQQREKLQLPDFPTTTIGSFPQTKEVRSARARWKAGTLSPADYEAFLEAETRRCVQFQEEIGIDMLVHGEFERNDMVEYFGEQLDGFAFTANGWVQSYGSRCVKPPVIFGDVSRPAPMTVRWSKYAQSLTKLPMKGMLTGPVTVLQWSFVRNDQPRSTTTKQIALALRDEVVDLETAGIAAIQIDEPAIREGLPLRRSDWAEYLHWAVESFRLCASGVRDETQIHTHMCYSEFNDIIGAIGDMDADVITIETSRSNMELLEAFVGYQYPNEIGPGVYDIHSPRVPAVQEMTDLMSKAAAVLPVKNLWVNP